MMGEAWPGIAWSREHHKKNTFIWITQHQINSKSSSLPASSSDGLRVGVLGNAKSGTAVQK
jgi:hypothetical protein